MRKRIFVAALFALFLLGCVQQPGDGGSGVEKEWFSIAPVQCGNNSWDQSNWPVKRLFENEEERIIVWLESQQGVKVYDYASRQKSEVVCAACSCPRGDEIAALVDASAGDKMVSLGWKEMEPIGCSKELKICDDGITGVGREAPFCEFKECQEPSKEKFELNKEFAIKKGILYSNDAEYLDIKVVSFDDSRCKPGVQCVWAGELGVTLNVNLLTISSSQTGTEIHLGETTAPEKSVYGYRIKLLAISEDKAEIIVSKDTDNPANAKWFAIEPKQCGSNPWEQAQWPVKRLFKDEEERITVWLSAEQGVEISGYAEKQNDVIYDVVCLACDCPRGDKIAVLVDSKDSDKMNSLGWAWVGETFCTEEAKLCDDGSYVGREAPFCEFTECPKLDENILVRKRDLPGYVINPVKVTTTIMVDGSVEIVTESYERGSDAWTTEEKETKKLSQSQVSELKSFIKGTNFFLIGEEDDIMC
ncbi:MAG: hypothetical protein AABW99_04545, partial [archaeon]